MQTKYALPYQSFGERSRRPPKAKGRKKSASVSTLTIPKRRRSIATECSLLDKVAKYAGSTLPRIDTV
jgi:hypothetical protein